MSKTKQTMIRKTDVIDIIDEMRIKIERTQINGLNTSNEIKLLEEFLQKIRQLEKHRRLIVLDGGKA